MPFRFVDASISRRTLLLGTAGMVGLCPRSYGFASDFWNRKGPGDWSADEVHQLLNKSPWAKQVTAEVVRAGGNAPKRSGGGGSGNGGMGTGGMGGGNNRGMGGMGGGNNRGMGTGTNNRNAGDMGAAGGAGGGSMPRPVQQAKGLVRWESAKPIQEAAKTPLSDPLSRDYVISLIGFPIGGRRPDAEEGEQPRVSNNALERIKSASSLTPKGKDAVPASDVKVVAGAVLIGFSKESLKLTPEDKEVAFVTAIGRMVIKTKFNLKEMTYHETLAI